MRLRAALVSGLVLAGLLAPSSASALVFAVTSDSEPRLLSFEPAAPTEILAATQINGLAAGEVVQGMDQRPATGGLYLLTTDLGGSARIRILDAATGQVSSPITLASDPSDLTNPYVKLNPSGGVGVDFNPVPDRLRIVTAADENLRVNPANGLVVTDSPLNPETPQVVCVAYTNSFPGAETTTLFDVNLASNSLATQTPPNNGTLVLVGPLGISPESGQDLAFDISPGNAGYLSARVAGSTGLYAVNLPSGGATLLGKVGDGATPIRGIAFAENVVRVNPDVVIQPKSGGAATVTVERLTPRLGARVDYATVEGSALAGRDYDARSGTLVFAAGEERKTITIPLHDDGVSRPTRSFAVVLSNLVPDAGTTATLGAPAAATVAITADQPSAKPNTSGGPPAGSAGGTPKLALLASASSIKLAKLQRKGLPVKFSCTEACTVTAQLRAGKRVVASKGAKLAAAGTARLRLKPSKAGIATIGQRKRLRVLVTAKSAAGSVDTENLSVRILRPPADEPR